MSDKLREEIKMHILFNNAQIKRTVEPLLSQIMTSIKSHEPKHEIVDQIKKAAYDYSNSTAGIFLEDLDIGDKFYIARTRIETAYLEGANHHNKPEPK